MTSLTAIFGNSSQKPQEDSEKLLQLYWDRAELKKEFAGLRNENFRLQKRIEQQEGATARVQQSLKHLEQLLADAGDGIYVTSWLGGNADGTTGDFSLGLRGHIIENGQIGRPVGEMNVTGNLKDLFAQLEMVGNDPYPYSTTLAPSLVFDGVDFSGVC